MVAPSQFRQQFIIELYTASQLEINFPELWVHPGNFRKICTYRENNQLYGSYSSLEVCSRVEHSEDTHNVMYI